MQQKWVFAECLQAQKQNISGFQVPVNYKHGAEKRLGKQLVRSRKLTISSRSVANLRTGLDVFN